MAKTKTILGCFVRGQCCVDCEWFAHPLAPFPRDICPECGSSISALPGQYQIQETTSFFGGKKDEYIGFIRKGSGPQDEQ